MGTHHYSPHNSATRSVIALLIEKVFARFAPRSKCQTRPRFSGGYLRKDTRIFPTNTAARAVFRLTFYSTKSIKSPDTPQKGTKTVRRGEGENSTVETTEADMIEHRRLQIDARKWLIGKMAPKKYGDKQQIEHAGPDGGPITLEALLLARLPKTE